MVFHGCHEVPKLGRDPHVYWSLRTLALGLFMSTKTWPPSVKGFGLHAWVRVLPKHDRYEGVHELCQYPESLLVSRALASALRRQRKRSSMHKGFWGWFGMDVNDKREKQEVRVERALTLKKLQPPPIVKAGGNPSRDTGRRANYSTSSPN